MSKLRPETVDAPGQPCPTNGTAYLLIYQAVKRQPGLIHGRLDGPDGAHCAIGSYFAAHPRTALKADLIDEVALVNDSVPDKTPRQRRMFVQRWLRWKLQQCGFIGGRPVANPTTKGR